MFGALDIRFSCNQNTLPFIRFIYKYVSYTNGKETDNSSCLNTLANSFSIVKRYEGPSIIS